MPRNKRGSRGKRPPRDPLSRDERWAYGASDGPPPADLKSNQQEYRLYLHSPAWKLKREAVLNRAGWRCEECGKDEGGLQVHHRDYVRFGNEDTGDLEALCPTCHRRRSDALE